MVGPLEALAVLLALIGVIAARFESVWCWWGNGLSAVLYGWIFWQAGLPMDATLQLLFIAIALRGLLTWRTTATGVVAISKTSLHIHLLLGLIALIGIATLVFLRSYNSAATPMVIADCTIFVCSVTTTWMTERKLLESWLYWIAVDVLGVFVYLAKELYLTTGLYCLYIVLAYWVYLGWKRDLKRITSK